MNFKKIAHYAKKPKLFEKGTSVMWTDPYISQQLLELHINPDNDIASRGKNKIEYLSRWILEKAGHNKMKILDLGCGPGLYSEVLAQKGHSVTGVDFSNNSINYAINQAKLKQLDITYLNKNYLDLDFDAEFDLAMLIYMDFCVLLPDERNRVLRNIFKSLKKGGLFICDVVNEKNIDKKVISPVWEAKNSGFWKDKPYIALTNGYHFPEAHAFANHHIIIGEDNTVKTYIFWNLYYEKNELKPIFESSGFTEIQDYDNVLPDTGDCWNGENLTFYVCRK